MGEAGFKLCVISLGFRGHLNPLLGLTRELVEQGSEVTFFSPGDYAPDCLATGARHQAYDSPFNRSFVFPRVQTGQPTPFFVRSLQEARRVLPQVIEPARELAPDAILYDGACLSGGFLGKVLDVPAIKLCPTYASTETYTPFAEGRKAFLESAAMRAAYDEEAERLASEFGVRALDFDKQASHVEPLNIVFMPRVFHPSPEKFDDRFLFVGPCLRAEPETDIRIPGDPEGRLLYVSLGTLNNDFPEFFTLCARAFAGKSWRVLLSIGNRVDRKQLGEMPPNVTALAEVPQLSVLREADLFVTQGGMNSTQEALHFGVPLVVIPSTQEQSVTAKRVEELRVGAEASLEGLTAEALAALVDRVDADEAIQKNAARLATISREAGGAKRAANAICAFLSQRRAGSGRGSPGEFVPPSV